MTRRPSWRRRWLAALTLMTLAGSSLADEPLPRWSLQLPADAPVQFIGVASLDEDGMAGTPMMYPAPNAGGLVVAILTHSLLVDSARRAQREKLLAAANAVVAPYRGVLDGFGHPELRQRVHRRASPMAADEGELVVESAPMFALTQDEKAIVLDNLITFRGTPAGPQGVYQGIVRVVSDPAKGTEPRSDWLAGGGERLKDECARLVAESIEMALLDARPAGVVAPAPPAQRTVRYDEGGTERMERAVIVRQHCGRLIIRNLRGHLMSVPAKSATASCPP
ncbi:hypothetical protein [Zoogloea oryzae]|uniref:hypothetical protein n=1 Tax=Zoogloea oryzae TaxID=310767 RepID=UPI0024E11315|nr:hypothetical protein [Zoogloea oryzae]